jgi:hypothetical protein
MADAAGVGPARPCSSPGFKAGSVASRIAHPSGGSGARTRKGLNLGGFRDRCRRPTLGLPLRERMAQDSNLPTARAVTSGFQPRALPDQPAILERSMKDSNLRTGRPVYAVAGRCRSRWANAPWCPTRDSNPDPPRSERGASASWARRAWSERRGSNPLCDRGKVECHREHFAHIEPPGGIEPPASAFTKTALCG